MKKAFFVLLSLSFVFLLISCGSPSVPAKTYDEGYEDGYRAGHSDGYDAGQDDVYSPIDESDIAEAAEYIRFALSAVEELGLDLEDNNNLSDEYSEDLARIYNDLLEALDYLDNP